MQLQGSIICRLLSFRLLQYESSRQTHEATRSSARWTAEEESIVNCTTQNNVSKVCFFINVECGSQFECAVVKLAWERARGERGTRRRIIRIITIMCVRVTVWICVMTWLDSLESCGAMHWSRVSTALVPWSFSVRSCRLTSFPFFHSFSETHSYS